MKATKMETTPDDAEHVEETADDANHKVETAADDISYGGWVCQDPSLGYTWREKWAWPGSTQATQNLGSHLKYLCNG